MCCLTQLYNRLLCFSRCQNIQFFLCSLILVLIHVLSDQRPCDRVAFFFTFPRLHDQGPPASRFTARHPDPYPAFGDSTSSSMFTHFLILYHQYVAQIKSLHDQLLCCTCCQNVRYFHFSDVLVLINVFQCFFRPVFGVAMLLSSSLFPDFTIGFSCFTFHGPISTPIFGL